MTFLRSSYFLIMGVSVTAASCAAAAAQHGLTVLFHRPRDGSDVHRVASAWGRTIVRLMPGWHVDIHGEEHLPKDREPMVIVANHESITDIWAMYFLGMQFRWLAKEEAFRIPGVGHAMRWANYVPVRRGSKESTSEAMAQSRLVLQQGVPMFFFPEGTRSTDGQLKPFKTGAFRLACDEQVKVLPIAIHGAGDLLKKKSLVPGKAKVKIRVLPPLAPPSPGEDLERYAAKVRELIANVHAQLV